MYDAEPLVFDSAAAGQTSARLGVGLHHLRYVLAAAEYGGFRRAARKLGVQQSAVSRRIKELEARLGAPIFERSLQGVQLTKAGEDFVRGAQTAVMELDLMVDRVADAGRDQMGSLSVGVLGGLGGGPLQGLLQQLVRYDDGLRVDLVEGEAPALVGALLAGRLDLAFLLDPPGQLTSIAAWRERLMIALTIDDPLCAKSALKWSDLVGRRVLSPTGVAPAVVALASRRAPNLAVEVLNAGAGGAARMTALGQGCAIVNEGALAPVTGVAYRPIARGFLPFRAVVGRRPEKPAIRRLLALVEATA
ncbi:LysR family transcriptional regulator [Caulobacter hibisci]|uniref:LysR family transcriptional regulator n=1 Tax=Caulobacter hibisci TaxID=2035993 RepID=A0ABS0SZV8_9CAUL|nr:LysR family transcriptional regulator [Caulobacter hibisci]MBI1685165.1 LysR family transcriptional regulator [Caulobacter hibisci]